LNRKEILFQCNDDPITVRGGSAALQQRLNVKQHALELWLSGRATVPEWVFLLAVEIARS
jgi:hypothetical protein